MTDKMLLFIAQKSGLYRKFQTSTVRLSKSLNISQQTVSRKLILLEKDGLISRTTSPRGMSIKIEKKGKLALENEYSALRLIFEKRMPLLQGKIISGVGEGKYYVNAYLKQFTSLLGKKPFSGTLNLEADPAEIREFLHSIEKKTIPGFSTSERSYGAVDFYPVRVQNHDAAVIVPERTGHSDNTIEIISSVNLRKLMKTKDNQLVEVRT